MGFEADLLSRPFKQGGASLTTNSRPIVITPVLRRLFIVILLVGSGSLLDSLQRCAQGAFGPDYSRSDIIMFLRMVAEKVDEWGEEVPGP